MPQPYAPPQQGRPIHLQGHTEGSSDWEEQPPANPSEDHTGQVTTSPASGKEVSPIRSKAQKQVNDAKLRLAELHGRLAGLNAAEVELKKYREKEEREEAEAAAERVAQMEAELGPQKVDDGRWFDLEHSRAGLKSGELSGARNEEVVGVKGGADPEEGGNPEAARMQEGHLDTTEKQEEAPTVAHLELMHEAAEAGSPATPSKHLLDDTGGGAQPTQEADSSDWDPIEKAMRELGLVRREPRTINDCVPHSCTWFGGGLSRRSPLRNTMFGIRQSSQWAAFFFLIIACNALYISLWPGIQDLRAAGTEPDTWVYQYGVAMLEAIDVLAYTVLGFEIAVGVIALGLYGHETAYINSSFFHIIDLLAFVFGIVEWIARLFGVTWLTLRPFRLLRIFRAAQRLDSFAGIKNIMLAMRIGSRQLITAVSLLFAMMCAFSIAGMSVFQHSFARRCVTEDLIVPPCASDHLTQWRETCNLTRASLPAGAPGADTWTRQMAGLRVIIGGYPYERWCKIIANKTAGQFDGEWELDSRGQYHSCPAGQRCETIGNPQLGLSHYDHFGGALPAVLQVVAVSGYQDVLWRSVWSEPLMQPITWVIYVLATVLCTFLVLNLFVAIVTGTFRRVRISMGSAFEEMELEKLREVQAAQHKALHVDASFAEIIGQDVASGKAKSWMASVRTPKTALQAEVMDEDGEPVLDAGIAVHVQSMRVIENRFFIFLTRIVILSHMIAMASRGARQVELWGQYARYADLSCTIFFAVENVIRMFAAPSASQWFHSAFNQAELLITVFGVVGLAIDSQLLLLGSAFRVFRLMSVFPTLQALLLASVASIKAILNVLVFVLIFAFAFAVVGRWVFRDSMDAISRSNFGTFWQACLTIFQLMLGDSWSDVMFAAMQSSSDLSSQLFSAVFIVSWYLFSLTIVNNLFVAVIIENFEISETIESIEAPGRFHHARQMLSLSYTKVSEMGRKGLFKRTGVEDEAEAALQHRRKELLAETRRAKLQNVMRETDTMTLEDLHPMEIKAKRRITNTPLGRIISKAVGDTWVKDLDTQDDSFLSQDEPERSLLLFLPNDPIRRLCIWVGQMILFDVVIYSCIAVSCFFLMVTPPSVDYPGFQEVISLNEMTQWNQIFTYLFLLEAVVRIIADGLLFTRGAYLKSGWNVVDFTVLVLSLIDEFGILQGDGQTAKVIRMGRALKPLRLMKRNQGMRQVIDALISTMMPVMYVIIFTVFNYFAFAVIGVGLFQGAFFRCSTPRADYPAGQLECAGSWTRREDGVLIPSAWLNPNNHFDTFGDAVVTLFRVNTFKYIEILYDSMDVTSVGQSPKENVRPENCLFMVTYLIIGGLFCMNLFVGFVVDGFNNSRGATEIELQYARTIRQFSSFRPRYDRFSPPPFRFNARLRAFAESRGFQTFSASCVALNVIFLLMDHTSPTPEFEQFMLVQTWIFFLELALEVLLFLVAYGPGSFWDDAWKAFDLFVTISGGLGLLSGVAILTQGSKAFRLLRIIRLMRMLKPIRVILETLLNSLPQVFNILLLLFLVYSMFAVVAVQFFGTTRFGQRLGPTANFETYPYAMATIWQTIAGDEWFELMHDIKVEPPACTAVFAPGPNYDGPTYSFGDCGSAVIANPFFFAIILVTPAPYAPRIACQLASLTMAGGEQLGKQVLLTLFIGMILDNFSFILDQVHSKRPSFPLDRHKSLHFWGQVGTHEDSEWRNGASPEQMEDLAHCFKLFDGRKGTLSIFQLPALLASMPRPMGLRDHDASLDPCFIRRKRFEGEHRVDLEGRVRKIKATTMDLASAMMIRAELNVIVREQRRVEEIKRQMGWARYFTKVPGIDKGVLMSRVRGEHEVDHIEFEAYMMTIFHWRMPHKIPLAVKTRRYARLDEVIRVAQSLTVMSAFSRLRARRVRNTVLLSIRSRKERQNWTSGDARAQSRRQRISEALRNALNDAARWEVPLGALMRRPTGPPLCLTLHLLPGVPDNMLQHRVSVLRYSREKGEQLRHGAIGIRAMQSMLQTHDVVVQHVEPHLKRSDGTGGVYQIGLEAVSFLGWELVTHGAEDVLAPRTLMQEPHRRMKKHENETWQRLDCWLDGSAGQYAGSLLDLQAWLESPTQGVSGMQSVVRFNLGVHYYASEKLRSYFEHKQGYLESLSRPLLDSGPKLPKSSYTGASCAAAWELRRQECERLALGPEHHGFMSISRTSSRPHSRPATSRPATGRSNKIVAFSNVRPCHAEIGCRNRGCSSLESESARPWAAGLKMSFGIPCEQHEEEQDEPLEASLLLLGYVKKRSPEERRVEKKRQAGEDEKQAGLSTLRRAPVISTRH